MTTARRGLAPVRAVLDNGAVVVAKQSRTIDRGTSSQSADAIAEALDGRGVSLSVAVNRHVLSLICTCLVEDVEPVLSLVADVVMNATCPDAEVRTRRA